MLHINASGCMSHNGLFSQLFFEEMGVWGLTPRKVFEATPSRTLENALLQNIINFLSSLIFMLMKN